MEDLKKKLQEEIAALEYELHVELPKEIARATGSRVAFRTDSRIPYQLDGDTAGECSTMVAEVEPGALLVMVPGK